MLSLWGTDRVLIDPDRSYHSCSVNTAALQGKREGRRKVEIKGESEGEDRVSEMNSETWKKQRVGYIQFVPSVFISSSIFL